MKRVITGMAIVILSASALPAAVQGPPPAKIAAGDLSLSAGFGKTVAVSGDTAAIGAWQQNVGTTRTQGAVYVYVRQGDAWVEEAKLVASDGALKDYFGQSLAIDRDTIVVGVPQADIDKRVEQGAVYVFVRQGGQWIEQEKLIAPSGVAKDDIFGMSVDISGDTLFVGAPGADNAPADKLRTADGAVHVFTRTNNVWTARQKLTGTGTGPAFGMNVALDEATAAISSGGGGDRSDAIHVFTNTATGWKQEATIDSPRESADQVMMNSVSENLALSGTTLVVGGKQRGSQSDGAVYVYVRENAKWVRQAKLSPADGTKGDCFGWTVDISGDTVVAGAWAAGAQVRGAAYLFTRQRTATGVTWVEERKITAADGQPGDTFGSDVAISSAVVIVGATNQDLGKPNTNRGAAYIVARKGTK